MNYKVKHNNEIVHFRPMKSHFRKGCPLCNKVINKGDRIYLVASQNIKFPNAIVHASCVNWPPEPFDQNNPFVFAAGKISESWKEAQNFRFWYTDP